MFELSQEIWNSSSAARKQSRHTKKVAGVASTSRREGCASALMSSARQRGQRVRRTHRSYGPPGRSPICATGSAHFDDGIGAFVTFPRQATMSRCAGGQGLGEGADRGNGSTDRAGGGGPSGQGLHATDAAGTV